MLVKSAYRINTPHVISETIDDEVIILNFESGCYYSLNSSGMAVWAYLQEGRSEGEILVKLRQRFPDADEGVANDLSEILKQLVAELLIVPSEDVTSPEPGSDKESTTLYTKPTLEKFTDLQQLLLLDPIHDVDESGWARQTT